MDNPAYRLCTAGRKRIETAPYSRLSRYYDELMSHVDYDRWAGYILRMASLHSIKVRYLLDFACGTGKLAEKLAYLGFQVSAADGSAEMIEQAKKLRSKRIDFQVCDLRDRPQVGPRDLVICLYDSVNYLLEEGDLSLFFSNIRLVLRNKGLLIFDCSTRKNSLDHFDGYRTEIRIGETMLFRYAHYDKGDHIQHNEFEILPDQEDVIYYEHHQQRIWPLAVFVKLLGSQGFDLLAEYDGFTTSTGTELSDRVHFVARAR